jgi:3-dehydroquinate synthase
MKEIEEEVCCNKIKFIVGENILNFLNQIEDKKVLIYSKSIDITKIKNNLTGEVFEIPVNDGESFKTIENILSLVRELLELNIDRGDNIIAVGGGSILDSVGFLASIYLRGINLINIPTTLLAMVDAAIGGKNGVNFEGYKNILGTFYQPTLILAELEFLKSLKWEELKKGIAEVIKYGIVLDKDLYDFLSINKELIKNGDKEVLEEIIFKSALNKIQIVKEDERETKGIRIVLNFGHTVGHVIEAATDFKVPHGYAISLGMLCEAKIAEEMGISEEGVVEDVVWLLSLYELPYTLEKLGVKIDLEKALKALERDKKVRKGYVMMPFPTRIGKWKRADIPIETLKGFITQCISD